MPNSTSSASRPAPTAPGAAAGGHDKVVLEKRYRPEIEGLRTVAAFLVTIYHIWLMRVSGGVDVFFVVSGFLITTSLLSRHAREGGRPRFGPFILGLLRRLLPNALTVLLAVTVASAFLLPAPRHRATMTEILASLFYFENWQLATVGTDYLDQANEKSPVQHFWAMSIQGQFYVLVFVTVLIAIWLATRTRWPLRKTLLAVFGAVAVTSFAFSLYLTAVNQPWAYFDTRARFWEFLVGGFLAMVLSRVVVPRLASWVLGWAGLATLVGTGLVMDVGANFPGWAALLPVSAAVVILVAGQNPSGTGVERFLGSRPMVFLGGLSYGLYLWHWPLLSFYYVLRGTKDVPLLHGVGIIAAALGLSYLSTRFVERPMVAAVNRRGLNLRGFAQVIALVTAVLLALGAWFTVLSAQGGNSSLGPDHPGAMARTEGFPTPPNVAPIPSLADVKEDKAKPYVDGCHQDAGVAEVIICEYGQTEDYEYTVALVGGSKSTHWLPALETFAHEEHIRLLNVTKSGCVLALDESDAADCNEWNENVVDQVADEGVDLVFTLADSVWEEEVPEGYLAQFRRFEDLGIPILALRDTPWFTQDVPECLGANGTGTDLCDSNRASSIKEVAPWSKVESPPSNVTYVDHSDVFCTEDKCPAVIGNVIAYIDVSHMSATFSTSFGPILRPDVMGVLES